MSPHKKQLKRMRKRERARSRTATVAQQPIAAEPVTVRLNGADIFKSLENHFDELLGPRTPEDALIRALVSK
jgi:hypothetical protein